MFYPPTMRCPLSRMILSGEPRCKISLEGRIFVRKVMLMVGLVLPLQLVLGSTSSTVPLPSGGFWHTVRRSTIL
jgi:hypothetical protein